MLYIKAFQSDVYSFCLCCTVLKPYIDLVVRAYVACLFIMTTSTPTTATPGLSTSAWHASINTDIVSGWGPRLQTLSVNHDSSWSRSLLGLPCTMESNNYDYLSNKATFQLKSSHDRRSRSPTNLVTSLCKENQMVVCTYT